MHISPFFRHLRSAYDAEIDDLTFDSEGVNILKRRLTQRRKEMAFLISMIELSPEMVAVVFHQAFKFKSVPLMDHLLSLESDELTDWEELSQALEIAPWAQEFVQLMRQQAQGEWMLAVAAALEYMFHKHDSSYVAEGNAEQQDAKEEDADSAPRRRLGSDDEHDDQAQAEASADWLVDQGFDRKE